MKAMLNLIIFLILMIVSVNFYGQSKKLDSLLILYEKAGNDSVRINLINEEIGYYFERKNPDSALYFYGKALKMAEKQLSDLSDSKSDNRVIFLKLKANTLRYIGIVKYEMGIHDEAIDYVIKSLKIYEDLISKLKNTDDINECKTGKTYCYVPLGNINYDRGEFDKALNYYYMALKIHEELGNIQPISGCYINIGNVYFDKEQYDSANVYYLKSLEISEKLGDKKGMSKCYNNIGNVLIFQKKYDGVIEYYIKSLKIKEEFEDKFGIAMVNSNLAEMHVLMSDSVYGNSPKKRVEYLNIALKYGHNAIDLAREIKAIPLENPASKTLMKAYKKLGNFEKSLEFAEIFIATSDSMFKEEKTKAITNAEKRFESEKKQLQIDKLNNEKELDKAELLVQKEQSERKKLVMFFVIAGLIMVIAFAIFIVNRLRISRKQKRTIESQKVIVEEKNEELNQLVEEVTAQRDEIESQRDLVTMQKNQLEVQKQRITDSINYAKRIQVAVLPSGKLAEKVLGNHFILFKPKDIVSGDFYWATRINHWLIVTVVDCTGHGVPGAFMSMLGVSFLNEIVRKQEVTKASEVLDNLREYVIEALQQKVDLEEQQITSSISIRDGMDIVLCVLNTETNHLQFAGANNPLYIVSEQNELREILPDKQSVAFSDKMNDFNNHEIQLSKGDILYLITDGYQDQFGGLKNKKFMARQLKELFVQIADKPLSEQHKILDNTFETWKGKNDQIDDVAILGLKI